MSPWRMCWVASSAPSKPISLIWSVFLWAAIAWIAPRAIWSLAANTASTSGLVWRMSSIAPTACSRSNWPVTSLTIFVLAPAFFRPSLTPSTRSMPTWEPGMPDTIASVPRLCRVLAMYSPALTPPSLFSVPTYAVLGFQSGMSESNRTTGMRLAAFSSTGLRRSESDGAITSASTSWASRFSTRSICSTICVSSPAALVSTFTCAALPAAWAPFSVLTQYSWLSDLGTKPIRVCDGLSPQPARSASATSATLALIAAAHDHADQLLLGLLGRLLLADVAALAQDDGAVGDLDHVLEVVADHDHARALLGRV